MSLKIKNAIAVAVIVAALLAAFSTIGIAASNARTIRITANGQVLTARLVDSATTRDFVSLLPLDLILEDFGDAEKIAHLPRRLSTEGAPQAIDPVAGDVTYYAPWGNLAIFVRDFRHSPGLVRLGAIESGFENLKVRGLVNARIERVDN